MADLATRADVARLFGRAAFGATRTDLTTWTGRPYAEAVDSLFPPGPPGTAGRAFQADDAERLLYEGYGTGPNLPQQWWLERMRSTPYPIEERMTLFWHDHFATGHMELPDVGHLMAQNQTLRVHALGSFRDLANAMTVDPAMLYWLNGIANHVDGVNENYAREFFELFTLGVFPQVYTETDIREAAKAFTGWTVNSGLRQPTFVPARHHNGTKTFLGQTIGGYPAEDPRNATEYKEITDVALAHDSGRSASRFLAYKLVLQFGYQPDESNLPGDPVVEAVAAAFRANGAWSIRDAVRTMLLHPGWRYADVSAQGGLVRSPVEVVVHAAKVLQVPCSLAAAGFHTDPIHRTPWRAGQQILRPPSVGGWPTGLQWLSQSTALGRYEILTGMYKAYREELRNFVNPPPAAVDLAGWAAFMGLAELSGTTTAALQAYLANPGTLDENEKQTGIFILVGASPDWQVM